MAVTTFAAIDISSYEITMKIFEFSKKGGFRTVDDIRYRLNLGVGVYSGGTMDGVWRTGGQAQAEPWKWIR